MGVQRVFSEKSSNFYEMHGYIFVSFTINLTLNEHTPENTRVYVYVYGYKVCLHVYKNCVNVAALVSARNNEFDLRQKISISNFYLFYSGPKFKTGKM